MATEDEVEFHRRQRALLVQQVRSALPALLKAFVACLRLSPCPLAKYRLCRETWGFGAPPGQEAAHA